MPSTFYADIPSLIRKIDMRANNSEKSSTMKIDEDTPCGNSMSVIWGFDHIKRKHTSSREKDFMKTFLWFFKWTRQKYIWFWKEKNLTVNKRRINIISICRNMLQLWKKNP